MHSPVYLGNNRLLLMTCYGRKLLCPSEDLSVGVELAASGTHESPLTRYFCQQVKPGQVVVELGAHIGYFTILLGHLIGPTGKLFALEPHPRCHAFLLDNLSINYFHDRVQSYRLAAFSRKSRIAFYASRRFLGNSSLHQHNEAYHKHYLDEFDRIEVDAVAVDDLLPPDQSIDFVKVDIEGGEYQAFLGMERVLSTQAKNVVFELNRNMLQADWEPFAQLLCHYRQTFSKRFFVLNSEGSTVEIDLDIVLATGECPYLIMTD